MKSPKFDTYVFGNVFVGGFIFLFTAFLGYKTVQGEGDGWFLLLMVLITAHCGQCFNQVQNYRLWKKEWDAMGDTARRPQAGARSSLLVQLGGGIIWLVLIWFLMRTFAPDHPTMRLVVVTFVGVGLLAWLILQRRGARPRTKPVEDIQVAHCLPVPAQSAEVGRTYAALPDYCLRVLSRTA